MDFQSQTWQCWGYRRREEPDSKVRSFENRKFTPFHFQESDGGEKSDGDLVVDVGNEDENSTNRSGLNNGNGDHRGSVENGPSSTGPPGSASGERRPTGDR